jgi:hypothetical protein
MESTQPDLEIAYHEAGHCVVAWLLGDGVQLVTIVPDPDAGYLGCCWPGEGADCGELGHQEWAVMGCGDRMVKEGCYWRPATPGELALDALVAEARRYAARDRRALRCAAGEAATRIAFPARPRNLGTEDDEDDARAVTADWEGAVLRAMAYLGRPRVWPFVKAIARDLAAAGSLDGELVRAVLRRVVTSREYGAGPLHACVQARR